MSPELEKMLDEKYDWLEKRLGIPKSFLDAPMPESDIFNGEDGHIVYDDTLTKFTKYNHVLSWLGKAYSNAKMSHAKDRKVGAVVINHTLFTPHILSDGYNGTRPGEDNCCEDDQGESLGTDVVIHAERNALEKLEMMKISALGCAIATTRSPCSECVDLIIKSGIREVYFCEQHRLVEPLLRLQLAGIKVVYVPKFEVLHHMTEVVEMMEKDQ